MTGCLKLSMLCTCAIASDRCGFSPVKAALMKMTTIVAENNYGAILSYPTSFKASLVTSTYGQSTARPSEKKRRKRKPHKLNRGEQEQRQHHAQITEWLQTAHHSLVSVGRAVGYIPVQQSESTWQQGDVDLVSLCELDSLIPAQDTHSPHLIQGDGEVVDVFGHMVTNSVDKAVTISALGTRFLVPEHSSFLLSDLSKIEPLLSMPTKVGLLVMDPPWENRSAIRGKKYSWLSNEELLTLPVPRLLAGRAVVAVWVTNKRSIATFVRTMLFPHWAVEYIGEWYWIKVTTAGDMVWPLESTHKKPYETLIIGRARPDPSLSATQDGTQDDGETSKPSDNLGESETDSLQPPPVKRVRTADRETLPHIYTLLAAPTTTHSQKPYLGDLLGRHAPPDSGRLELFARNMLPGWTSWGNEVLKFQILNSEHDKS